MSIDNEDVAVSPETVRIKHVASQIEIGEPQALLLGYDPEEDLGEVGGSPYYVSIEGSPHVEGEGRSISAALRDLARAFEERGL